MILKYSVENFKCFQEKETINFKVKKKIENSSKKYFLINDEILPIISIYGPNGGGKTSLLSSILVLREIVVNSLHTVFDNNNIIKNENSSNDTKWEIEFIEKDKTIYSYKLFFDNQIKFESLHKNEDLIFERNGNNFKFCKNIPSENIKTENISPKSSILLFLFSLFNNRDVAMVMGEFKKMVYLDTSKDITLSQNVFGSPLLNLGNVELLENEKKKFLKIFKELDLNIIDLDFQRNPLNPNLINIFSIKKSTFNKTFTIPLGSESKGTLKLIHLMTLFIQGLHNKSTFIIDELDSALHTKLLVYIIKLFNSSNANKGAQIIYTSHDISSLNNKNFRRDQIYFCARNESYFSNIISLKDIGARNDEVYSKKYLEGKYGYDPYVDFSFKAFDEKE